MDAAREVAKSYGMSEAEMRERVLRNLMDKGLPG